MATETDFDTLLDGILSDYQTRFGEAPEKLLFIRSAVLTSALWGVYRRQDKIQAEIFPDTASSAGLAHHAWIRGLSKTPGETDAGLLQDVLTFIRRPPAGGNRYDFERWAEAVQIAYPTVDNPTAAMLSESGLGSWSAAKAVDGLTDQTAWSNQGAPIGSYVAADLGSGCGRYYAAVRLFMASAGSQASFAVEYSDDGTNWTGVATLTPNAAGWNEADWTPTALHRYWRLRLTNSPSASDSVCEMAWVAGAEFVSFKRCVPCGHGTGTVDVLVLGSVGLGQPSDTLLAAVFAAIDAVRVVTGYQLSVYAPAIVVQGVSMTVYGGPDASRIAENVASYLNSLPYGQTLFLSQLYAIAIEQGATNAVITTPATDIVPATGSLFRAGSITVVAG